MALSTPMRPVAVLFDSFRCLMHCPMFAAGVRGGIGEAGGVLVRARGGVNGELPAKAARNVLASCQREDVSLSSPPPFSVSYLSIRS